MAEEQEHKNSSSVGVLLDKIKDSLQNETSTGTLRLPLVLDAPFSNLSNANTGFGSKPSSGICRTSDYFYVG